MMDYGYVLVFFGSLVEGDATLMTAAFLSHQGHLSFYGVLGTAALASTLLNETVYHLSRTRSRRYFEGKIAKHPKYGRVQDWIRSRSVILLLFSRYIFGFRMAIPAACGITGMRPSVFSSLNAAGAALWVIPLGYAGYAFGAVIQRFWHGVHAYEWHLALAALAIGWTVLVRYDPELHMVSSLLLRTRHFALAESSRLRHMMRRHVTARSCSYSRSSDPHAQADRPR
jgi:membrane protein DedA with SNARE-associated domain